jgi:hypothetical protein
MRTHSRTDAAIACPHGGKLRNVDFELEKAAVAIAVIFFQLGIIFHISESYLALIVERAG